MYFGAKEKFRPRERKLYTTLPPPSPDSSTYHFLFYLAPNAIRLGIIIIT